MWIFIERRRKKVSNSYLFKWTFLFTSLRREQLKTLIDSQNPFDEADEVFRAHFRLTKFISKNLIEELEPFNTQSSNIPFHLRVFCFNIIHEWNWIYHSKFQVLSTLYFIGHRSYQKCIAPSYFLPMPTNNFEKYLTEIC